jgi:hypothetical protein
VAGFGQQVRSWKRVDSTPYPTETLIDAQTLWSSAAAAAAAATSHLATRGVAVAGAARPGSGVGYDGECPLQAPAFRTKAEAMAALPSLSQPQYAVS